MSKVTEKILETIKSKHIAPKPRWYFILQRILFWFFTFLSVIFGSLSFSVMIFSLVNNDWEIIELIDRSPFQHILNTLPYIWILILILFLILAYYNAKHTKGAYKYEGYWYVIISILLSIGLGSIFYAFGFAPRIHIAAQNLPFFQNLIHNRKDIWLDADNGLLAGEILEVLDEEKLFKLIDLHGNVWVVIEGNDYISSPKKFKFLNGTEVRMIGKKIDDYIFAAQKIMPYQIGPGIQKGGRLKFMINNY